MMEKNNSPCCQSGPRASSLHRTTHLESYSADGRPHSLESLPRDSPDLEADFVEVTKESPSLWKKSLLGFCMLFIPLFAYGMLTKYGYIQKLLNWAGSIGIWGNIIIIAFIIFCSFPWALGAHMTSMACGFLYKWFLGFLTVFIGVFLGSSCAFFILRYYCKEKILDLLGNGKKMQAIINAVNQEPIKFSLLIRAIPITSGLQTSILCLTNIKYSTFLWTSLLADLPQHALYLYLGTQIGDLTKVLSGESTVSSTQMYLMIFQMVVAVSVILFVLNMGRKIFQKIDQNDVEAQIEGSKKQASF